LILETIDGLRAKLEEENLEQLPACFEELLSHNRFLLF
jgi:hypothetical protein